MNRISRRAFIGSGALLGGTLLLPRLGVAGPVQGGTLVVAEFPEPSMLTSILQAASSTNSVSSKMFDGLLYYDVETMEPRPQLAESWEVAEDGLSITFHLRKGVTWHDGHPFTSADVQYSFRDILPVYSSRGKSIYAHLTDVETPDEHTAILRLAQPSPYIMYALNNWISQIWPRHLYEGTDVRTNPHNTSPIGTGPFRFVEWDRGNFLRLERNPDYWDQPKPYLDQLIYRFLPDGSARAAALEAEDVDVVGESRVPGIDLERLRQLPYLELDSKGYNAQSPIQFFSFNLDRPMFQDVRVRRAIAHAIDREFIVRNIWYGFGEVGSGPLSPLMTNFFAPDLPTYPFDPARAEALLDEAGVTRGADGIRFEMMHDAVQYSEHFPRTGEYIRDVLGRIGIKVTLRNSDIAAFAKRIFTDRDFDTANYYTAVGPDPAISSQRQFWSKAFTPGVAYTNGSHYASDVVDAALEAAAVEIDPAKRREHYVTYQRQVVEDVPEIALVAIHPLTIMNRRVKDLTTAADGIKANFANAYIEQG